MAATPECPLPAHRSLPRADAVVDPPDERAASLDVPAPRRRGLRRTALLGGSSVGVVALVILLTLLGETAAAVPHPRSTERPPGGPSVGAGWGEVAAVLLAVTIVVTSVVVALRLVFPRTDPTTALLTEIDEALDGLDSD